VREAVLLLLATTLALASTVVVNGQSGNFTAIINGSTLVLDGLSVEIPRVSYWIGNGSYTAFGFWYSPGAPVCTEGMYPDRPKFYISCNQGAEINVVAVKDPKARVTCRDIASGKTLQPSETWDKVEIYRLSQSLGVECKADFAAATTSTSNPLMPLLAGVTAASATALFAMAVLLLRMQRLLRFFEKQ